MSEHPEIDWSFALPPGERLDRLLVSLKAGGLVEVCEECCAETLGTVFHNVPPATRQDIASALFEVA